MQTPPVPPSTLHPTNKDENRVLASNLQTRPILLADHMTEPVVLLPGIKSRVLAVVDGNFTPVQPMHT